MSIIKTFDIHICDTGKQISFRRVGESLDKRDSICQIFIYNDIGIMYGIQGENFFRAIHEHMDEMFSIARFFMGYIWPEHTEIYRSFIGLNVEEHHYSTIHGEPVVWIVASRSADPVLEQAGDGGSY